VNVGVLLVAVGKLFLIIGVPFYDTPAKSIVIGLSNNGISTSTYEGSGFSNVTKGVIFIPSYPLAIICCSDFNAAGSGPI
jgi:hypothetical protein